jgi:MoxR-like ATPase
LTTADDEPVITPVAAASDIDAMRHLVRDIPAASNVIDYALRIVRASRPADAERFVRKTVVSPLR